MQLLCMNLYIFYVLFAIADDWKLSIFRFSPHCVEFLLLLKFINNELLFEGELIK